MTAYAQLADLKLTLKIAPSDTGDDTLLQNALDNASAIIDDFCNRTFAAEADATIYHDAVKNVDGRTLWLNGELCQLTSVVNGDGTPIAPTAIVTQPSYLPPYFGLVLKLSSGLIWNWEEDTENAIAVAGRWAYSVTPPLAIVQATLRFSAWLYRQPANALDLDRTLIIGNTTLTPATIPSDLMAILAPYRKKLT